MASLRFRLRGILLAALAVAALWLAGCATPDDEVSGRDRPWNEPQGWETGMPPGLEGRR
jgi:hypothetical protein